MSRIKIAINRARGFIKWLLPKPFLSSKMFSKLKRLDTFTDWFLFRRTPILLSASPKERRLLIIYDLSRQPFSIGDFLILHVGSLIEREKYNIEKIDCAVVYEDYYSHPAIPEPFKINDENVMYHLASILPVAQVNQHLGSLFLFESHKHLERFIFDNADLYYVWPESWSYIQKDEIYRPINRMVYEYHKQHGNFPHLTCRPFLIDWAFAFFHRYASPSIPVSVNIRNNKWVESNNSCLEAWLGLFDYCLNRYPVKFIIICAFEEVDDCLRRRSNVIIAKEYHTGIEQDLALISASAFHMGVSSGPSSIAIWSSKPYLQISAHFISDDNLEIYNATRENNFVRLGFANQSQKFALPPETEELLISEFERMWNTIDFSEWDWRKKIVDPLIIEKLSYKR